MPHLTRERRAAAVLAVLAVVVLAGCSQDDEDPVSPPAADPTPLAEYDASTLSLSRQSPCPGLTTQAAAPTLGGEVTTQGYGSGERARLSAVVRDVAQEEGCVFRGEEAATGRAWVFTPPVPVSRAQGFVRTLAREQNCRRVQGAAAFGDPGVGRICERGKRAVGSYGGLFGEAWLGCSVQVPRAAARGEQGREELVRRTGEWCVQVLEAARAVSEAEE